MPAQRAVGAHQGQIAAMADAVVPLRLACWNEWQAQCPGQPLQLFHIAGEAVEPAAVVVQVRLQLLRRVAQDRQ